VALISFTNRKIWSSKPTVSDFVTEISNLYKCPKYQIKVSYAFNAIYFTLIERKIYVLVKSKPHNGWVIGFMHTSVVQRNYIPYIQGVLNALDY
jgi:hypothetical protein